MGMGTTMLYTAAFLTAVMLIFFIVIKIKNSKKKASAPKNEPQAGDDHVDENNAKTGTNSIRVIIWRQLGGGMLSQVGDPIMCEEKPDDHTNLVVINEEKRFKEDLNFNKNRVFETLEISLKSKDADKKTRITILRDAIKTQQELVESLSSDISKNETYNAPDEKLKLRQLKVLLASTQKEVQGEYVRLGKGGVRQYELVAIDGILYPYHFGSKYFRVYPDLLVKKKIFNQENTIFSNEVGNLQKGILNWLMIAALIVGLLMMTGGGFMMKHAYSRNAEITLMANQGAISCTNTLAGINENYGTIIGDYQRLQQKETKSIISPELPNSNIGGIVVDPSKIQR